MVWAGLLIDTRAHKAPAPRKLRRAQRETEVADRGATRDALLPNPQARAPRRREDGPSGSDQINRATGAVYFELSR